MKRLQKSLSAAARNKDSNKAFEIQCQIDELEKKAKPSVPKRWQYEGKKIILVAYLNQAFSKHAKNSLFFVTSYQCEAVSR